MQPVFHRRAVPTPALSLSPQATPRKGPGRPVLTIPTWYPLAQLAVAITLLAAGAGAAADWPAWRHDGQRSGATAERLATPLQPAWTANLAPARPAWPEDPRLHFDASLEPIVAGGLVFVASNRSDSVTALSLADGSERWRFFADGPVRFAPLAYDGQLYFGSDDGCFYCLDAASGRLHWKFRAAPDPRRVLGSERLISAWPIRGGPVMRDGRIHFTAGIWPFEGTLLVSVNADPRRPVYDSRLLPDEISPQGYLATDNGRLFIPGGRDEAACVELSSGEFVPLRYSSRGKTDYHLAIAGDLLLHGDRVYDVATSQLLPHELHRPVVDDQGLYGVGAEGIVALDRANPRIVERADRRGNTVRQNVFPTAWQIPPDALAAATGQPKEAELSVELKAGEQLFGYHGPVLFAARLPRGEEPAQIVWTKSLPEQPARMVAADGKLLVATREGRLHALSAAEAGHADAPADDQRRDESPAGGSAEVASDGQAQQAVERILADRGDRGGYALMLGMDRPLLDALLEATQMHAVVLEPEMERVAQLRRYFQASDRYGTRLAVLPGEAGRSALPPYIFSLVVARAPLPADAGDAALRQIFQCLRPYGGEAWLESSETEHAALGRRLEAAGWEQARLDRRSGFTVITREGPLPGSADWTHEYGDTANTLMSRDELVKPPLGALWFGGPASANELYFNRHYWPPSLTVQQGRMFLQGPRVFAAIDIYTGRVLWKKPIAEGYSPGRRGNFFERVRVGFHYVAAPDAVYFSNGSRCELLDPQTGTVLKTFQFEDPQARWGRFRIWKDLLIGAVFLPGEDGESRPAEIVALDRHSGETVWKHKAAYSVPFVAIGGDRVFFYDGVIHKLYDDWKRKGLVPEGEPFRYIRALDARSGKQLWQRTTGRVVTWLGYSEDQDVLIGSNKRGLDAWQGADGEELWRRDQEGQGFAGHPESVWDKVILWKDRVIDQRGPGLAYDLRTGKEIMQVHPLTGDETPWKFTKVGHHCNYAIANPHMVTFRAGSAGFLDLESGTTARLNGFRSGCRNSLIPAGGVLNAPKFAHGCVCSYSLFTSLSLIHLPEADMWTYNAFERPGSPVRRLGVNLGAPGDRQAGSGTFWLDYPNVGGPSPEVAIEVQGESPRYFRQHTRQVSGEGLTWVAASGVEGLTSLKVQLGGAETRRCHVRLYFVEPSEAPVERRFDVVLQGRRVLEGFDVRAAAGGEHNRLVTRDFPDVTLDGTLTVELTARQGRTVLCGVEITPARSEPEGEP